MHRGFDVSHHQGFEDWANMRDRYGLTYGFAKATEGEGFRDSRFRENWSAMKDAGLVRGAYHFARPDADPSDDAAAFLNYVDPTEDTDLLVLDLETSELGQDQTNAWAKGWAAAVRRLAPRYVPGVYMGSGYLTNRTGEGLRSPAHFGWLWYPRYPERFARRQTWPELYEPPVPVRYTSAGAVRVPWEQSAWGQAPEFWQFSATWPVAGEWHDANLFNGGLAQLRALNAPTHQEADDMDVRDMLQAPIPNMKTDEAGDTQPFGLVTAMDSARLDRVENIVEAIAGKLGVDLPAKVPAPAP